METRLAVINEAERRLSVLGRNLRTQIDDRILRNRGMQVVLYFDTWDVYEAVCGLQAFYGGAGLIDHRRFDHDRVLAQALAFDDWIGPIDMLPSHQAEFLAWLERLLDSPESARDLSAEVGEFLLEVGVVDDEDLRHGGIGSLSATQKADLVRRQAGSAERFFKALTVTRGDWKHRLSTWRKRGGLKLNRLDQIDYSEILQSEEFYRLRRLLGERRPLKTVNNFNDAAALASLRLLVSRFRHGNSEIAVRFYDATGLFSEVVKEAQLGKDFEQEVEAGRWSPVLVGTEYLRLRAIYNSPSASAGQVGRSPRRSTKDLLDLERQIDELLETRQPLERDVLRYFDVDEQTLGVNLRLLEQVAFLEQVWLPTLGVQSIEESWRALLESQPNLTSPAFKDAVRTTIEQTRAALRKNGEEYRVVAEVWRELEEARHVLCSQLGSSTNRNGDPILALGLIRFGFPASTYAALRELFWAARGGEAEAHSTLIRVLELWRRCRNQQASLVEEMLVVVGVLWVGRGYATILHLCDQAHVTKNWRLTTMRLAALMESKRGAMRELEPGIEYLDGLASSEHLPTEEGATQAVALAWLYFRWWRALGGVAEWRESIASRDFPDSEKIIERALHFVAVGLRGLEDSTPIYVYALNQRLYYLVEGRRKVKGSVLAAAAQKLVGYKQHEGLWQPRYEDTLARYFHREASRAREEDKWRRLMDAALEHSKSACEDPAASLAAREYRSRLEVEYAGGFCGGE